MSAKLNPSGYPLKQCCILKSEFMWQDFPIMNGFDFDKFIYLLTLFI